MIHITNDQKHHHDDNRGEIQLALIDLYVAIKIRDEEEINNYDQNKLITERNELVQ